jgi:hypothetical protein
LTANSTKFPYQACEACRQRKTKCDEAKPACGRCARLGLHCSYAETILSKKNLSVVELTDTLKRMEDKLESLSELLHETRSNDHQPLPSATVTFQTPSTAYPYNIAATSPAVSQSIAVATPTQIYNVASPPPIDTARIREELSLTQRHSTAPQHLLCWPCSPVKLAELQLEYPVDLEIKMPRLSRSTAPPRCLGGPATPPDGDSWVLRLSLGQLNHLTGAYFSHFHPPCLILDEVFFCNHHLNCAMRSNFARDIHTCIVLLVCSLGSIALHHIGQEDWSQDDEDDLVGLGFFNMALDIFREIQGPDWLSVQCHLLTG